MAGLFPFSLLQNQTHSALSVPGQPYSIKPISISKLFFRFQISKNGYTLMCVSFYLPGFKENDRIAYAQYDLMYKGFFTAFFNTSL